MVGNGAWGKRTGVVALCCLLLVAGGLLSKFGVESGNAAVSSTLHAVVGPDFNITLVFDDGSTVTALPAGTYTVLVSDQSDIHNFHLYGPGVDLDSGIDAMGNSTWRPTFQNNSTYIFQCDVHSSEMVGRFTVGSVPTTLPTNTGGGTGSTSGTTTSGKSTTTGSTPTPLGTLKGTVGSAGKLSLTLNGKPVKNVVQGSYKVTVTDTTKTRGFTLRRVGVSASTAVTGVAFVGTKTVTVTLKPGSWKYYSPSDETGTAVLFNVKTS